MVDAHESEDRDALTAPTAGRGARRPVLAPPGRLRDVAHPLAVRSGGTRGEPRTDGVVQRRCDATLGPATPEDSLDSFVHAAARVGGDEAVEVDVVLPCLDEAEALPWVLGRMPAGLPRAGRRQRVERRQRRRRPAARRRRGRRAAARLRCRGRCRPAGRDRGPSSASATPTPRSTRGSCPRVVEPGAGRSRRPRARSPPADDRARPWPLHARLGNAELARRLRRRTGVRLHDLGPMRAARRDALVDLDLRDRRFGYPLEMVVRAADRGLAHRRGRRRLPARAPGARR